MGGLRLVFALFAALALLLSGPAHAAGEPMRVGVVGLTHTHVHWIFNSERRGEIRIVAVVEPNQTLVERYRAQYGFDPDIVYSDLEIMLDEVKPEGVTAFNSISEHLDVVRAAAPRGVHVMVEKPLAVSLDHAREMAALARQHGIELLTNFETTWYPTTHKTNALKEDVTGPIRKMVFHHGHQGPKKIGVDPEFLEWLTDPVRNGGGAITDFGCYGANIMTLLMEGQRPLSVTAVTQHFQPGDYPKVDDEATLIVTYPEAQGIIQASWNWPISRKDMEVYGTKGYVLADNRHQMRLRKSEDAPVETLTLEERPAPYDDPFALFRAVVRGEITLKPSDLSALENNMTVMEILDAGIRSAKSGQTVYLDEAR